MTRKCPRCGNEDEDAIRFCTSCGNPLFFADSETGTATIQQPGQIPPAAPAGRTNGRRVIPIVIVAVIVILVAFYFLQASGTISIFPPAPSVDTQKAAASPQATSFVIVENPSPNLTENPADTPEGTAFVTETPRTSPTVTKVPVCPSDRQACDGNCTDTMTDRRNCGGCSVSCTITETCLGGRCMPRCADSETSCADGCHDLLFDAGNCGFCGNACPVGLTCNDSVCRLPVKTAIPTYSG
ncbi:MAG: hypothetical protein EHM53_06180 [Methanoregulaceae archaeon]|nr:MAG: hypothetical protein EHM53_06180 [Methanoregulaceae archaeon]